MEPYIERPGCLVYKCKRCGEELKEQRVASVIPSLVCVMTQTKDMSLGFQANPKPLLFVHDCPDGNKGVSEIIGGEFDAIDTHPKPNPSACETCNDRGYIDPPYTRCPDCDMIPF